MNYIVNIENADQELLEKVIKTLDEQKFKRINFKRNCTGIRVFTNSKGKTCYSCGTYLGYIVYRKSGMKDYVDAETISLEGLLQVLNPTKEITSKAIVEPFYIPNTSPAFPLGTINLNLKNKEVTTEAEVIESTEIKLNKDKVIAAYNQVNPELQQFMRLLFGSELFVEKTYKVGDKFQKKSETFVLAKINMNVVTMMNLDTFTNFGNSIQVRDLENISDRELKQLLKVYYSEFKKID